MSRGRAAQATWDALRAVTSDHVFWRRRLAAPVLIEVRCKGPGHLLGIVYATLDGPLFVDCSDAVPPRGLRPELKAEAAAGDHDSHAWLHGGMWAARPDLLDSTTTEDERVVLQLRCRCGRRPIARAAIVSATAEHRPLFVDAPSTT